MTTRQRFRVDLSGPYLLAFLLPVLFVFIAFLKMGIHPFGDKTILSMDLWGQYLPMYAEQQAKGFDFFREGFSWNGSLGFNLYSQTAYYGNSPFFLFWSLFDRSMLVDVMTYTVLMKYGLSSLFFFVFAKKVFQCDELLCLAAACVYSLSGYSIAYMNQPMWADAVVFLPLVILGIEQLRRHGYPFLYVFSLVLVMISNFYIGFCVCIFAALWYLFQSLAKPSNKIGDIANAHSDHHVHSRYEWLGFILYSLLSAGLAAITLIPVFFSIRGTLASEMSLPNTIVFYHEIGAILSKLLPLAKVSHAYEAPNIYSGLLFFTVVPLFVLNHRISLRRRLIMGTFLFFLILSMNLNLLDYVWHGFHFPNQLPGRWSFAFTFLVMALFLETMSHRTGTTKFAVVGSVVLGLFGVMFAIGYRMNQEEQIWGERIPWLLLLCAIVYALLLIGIHLSKRPQWHVFLVWTLAVLIIGESGIHAIVVLTRDLPLSEYASYHHADEGVQEILTSYPVSESDFYRTEMNSPWTFNPGQLYGYRGITYYSSTLNGKAYTFLNALGYTAYAQNVSLFYTSDYPILNALFSVRYLIHREEAAPPEGFITVPWGGKYALSENPDALPIAYQSTRQVLDYDPDALSPIPAQNMLLNGITGLDSDTYQMIPTKDHLTENAEIIPHPDWEKQYYTRKDGTKPVRMSFVFDIAQEEDLMLSHGFRRGTLWALSDGYEKEMKIQSDGTIRLENVPEGLLTISFEATDVDLGVWGLELYRFDAPAFRAHIDALRSKPVRVEQVNSQSIRLVADADTPGLILTSISDDGGWTATVDGVKTKLAHVADCLIAVPVVEGMHEIQLAYRVPGLIPGIFVTLISLLVFLFLIFMYKKKNIRIHIPQTTVITPQNIVDSETDKPSEEKGVEIHEVVQKELSISSISTQTLELPTTQRILRWLAPLYCLFVAVAVMWIATKSSPLYPLNDWVDANSFLTVGKGMLRGMVPYRDLFEQKGPVLYMLHALAAMVSDRSFLGVFMIECIAAWAFLYFVYKLLALYLDGYLSLICLPLIAVLTYTRISFAHGDSVEELCIPLLAASLYSFFLSTEKYRGSQAPLLLFFLNGVIAGLVAWMKYTMLGFWIGWVIWMIVSVAGEKPWLEIRRRLMMFVLGGCAVTLVIVGYFTIHGAMDDLLNTYFFINITAYSSSIDLPERIRRMWNMFDGNLHSGPLYGFLLLMGFLGIGFLNVPKLRVQEKLSFFLIYTMGYVGIHASGAAIDYYFQIMVPFHLFGILSLALLLQKNTSHTIRPVVAAIFLPLLLVMSVPVTMSASGNYPHRLMKKEDMAQYRFAAIIERTPGATLLNFDFLDGGFYTVSGIYPPFRFFMRQNISPERFPLNMTEQSRYLAESTPDYVVLRRNPGETVFDIEIPVLHENYTLLDSHIQPFEGYVFQYMLFERKHESSDITSGGEYAD